MSNEDFLVMLGGALIVVALIAGISIGSACTAKVACNQMGYETGEMRDTNTLRCWTSEYLEESKEVE